MAKKIGFFLIILISLIIILGVLIFLRTRTTIATEPFNCHTSYVPNIDWQCDKGEEAVCICEENQVKLYCGSIKEKYRLINTFSCGQGCSCRQMSDNACACLP